jgi:hypothetical protein
MVKIKYIAIALLVAIVGVWAVVHFSESEEKRVKKQFDLLSEWASKDPGENAFTMAKKTQNIATLFAQECRFKADVASLSGSYTPEEISRYAAQARLQFTKVSLRFHDLNIQFPEHDMAQAILTARLTGRSNDGEYVNEIHELASVLRKIGNEWLFSEFEVVEVLRK